jgi:response regulator of citrate/malate metabolism
MKIMLIGGDNYQGAIIEKVSLQNEGVTTLFYNHTDPVKIISDFITERPSILIIDDDFLSPNTLSLLDVICRHNEGTRIIFTTSDTSIELGRQVSQLGIYYYAIKPIDESEFVELLNSILNKNRKYKLH